MKKLLVVSDTHGHRANIAAALRRFADADIVIHLGDYSRDAQLIRAMVDKPVYAVRGNCDIGAAGEDELTLTVEGVRILAVHGQKQNVKSSLLRLGLYALEKQAGLALFGHTHVPAEKFYRGALLYNPGSLGEPRGMRPSVGIVTLDNGAVRVTTARL